MEEDEKQEAERHLLQWPMKEERPLSTSAKIAKGTAKISDDLKIVAAYERPRIVIEPRAAEHVTQPVRRSFDAERYTNPPDGGSFFGKRCDVSWLLS